MRTAPLGQPHGHSVSGGDDPGCPSALLYASLLHALDGPLANRMPSHPLSPLSFLCVSILLLDLDAIDPPRETPIRQPPAFSRSPLTDDGDDSDGGEQGDDACLHVLAPRTRAWVSALPVWLQEERRNSPSLACQARPCLLLSYPQNLK